MSNSVIDAFKRLNVSGANESSGQEIFEVSYQYLSKVKNFNDINAFHNCIVSLINEDRYYRALQLLDEVSEEIHREFTVEKAYVYYKTGHFEQLKTLYQTATGSGNLDANSITLRALKHVMAQSYYQNGHISEALQLYRELISSNSVDNEVDMACNERAILSQLAAKETFAENPVTVVSAAEKTYDIVFNEALIELAGGNTASASKLLEEASSMCLEQNIDSNPADLALEIAPIKLTIAYIHQILGNTQKALTELKAMDLDSVADLMTRLTFRNNYIALSGTPENVNFAARELNYKDNLHHLRHKLTKPQFQILTKNHLLLSYQSGTLPKTSSYFRSKFRNQYAQDFHGDFTIVLYKILLKLEISIRDLQSTSEAKNASRKLFKFCQSKISSRNTDDEIVAASLLLVHFNSEWAKYDQALLVLEKLATVELEGAPENMHASVFGTLISLYETRQSHWSINKLEEFTKSLANKFTSLAPETLGQNKSLYEFARAFAFKLSAANSAQDPTPLLNLLKEANPKDTLVSSVLTGDLSGLVPAEDLASAEDVEDLLLVQIEDMIPKQQVTETSLVTRTVTKPFKVTKKSHKPKFPKNKVLKPDSDFDAEKDLDKERWLPMKLRSYYKPSKKDMKKKLGGHQGAVELSPAPAASQPAASSSGSKSKNNKNKKKKKGKK